MERGGAANHTLAAATKRPPPELDGTNNDKGDWTGTKRTKELHEDQQAVGGGRTGSRKRPHEYDELEPDVGFLKLYKCNYWEDPAYASRINFFGLGLAQNAALENHCERLHLEYEALMAEFEALKRKPDGGGAHR